ncbi:MAG: hypothetical protein KAJ19_16510 [Gammaproteobacteria bacterium]|nr:hypothetical protein [Gammaproteobacteria bacterium]
MITILDRREMPEPLYTDDQYHALFDSLPNPMVTVPRYHMESLSALKCALTSRNVQVRRKDKRGLTGPVPHGLYSLVLLSGERVRVAVSKHSRITGITVQKDGG